MTTVSKYVLSAVTGSMLLTFTAANALAAYACNGDVCWTIKEKYTYPADAKIVVHEDTWKPAPSITIREHGPGRGYYVGSDWRTW